MSQLSANQRVLRSVSFSNRFGDDLCEILLSFLSFEDKIRFECVSKQWKKLIFNKQKVLDFSLNYRRNSHKNSLNKLLINNGKEIDIKAFESVVKKCKFINNIEIDKYIGIENSEQVLQTITKYCLNLQSIQFNFSAISEKLLILFGFKCGQKLQNITFNYNNHRNDRNYKNLLKLFPNLVSVNNILINAFIDSIQLLIHKLIGDKVLNDVEVRDLSEQYVKRYGKPLKSLMISIVGNVDPNSQNLFLKILKSIALLENLQKLKFNFENTFSEEVIQLFGNCMKTIAIKCKQINSIVIIGPYFASYDCLQYFSHLNYLVINNCFNEEITAKQLIGCKQLTHLKLKSLKMWDNFFTDIHLYLPQIKVLYLTVDYDLTDLTINSLIKLNQLKRIELFHNCVWDAFLSITESTLCDLINNCESIQSIEFFNVLEITNQTMDALKALALRKPKVVFSHSFVTTHSYDVSKEFNNLPKNLKIQTNCLYND